MTYAAPMSQANPSKPSVDADALVECIRACYDCAQACTADADADLAEPELREMVRCIRLCLDCADLCLATGAILSRQTAFEPTTARTAIQACMQACRACGDECEEHARHGMAHCRTCMEACRRCERACNTVLTSLPA
jgi:hypothetical protein